MSAGQHAGEIYKVGLGSVRYLLAVGDLLIGWRLLVQAGIARAALAGGPVEERRGVLSRQDRDRSILRQEHASEADGAMRKVIESIDDEIMRISEDAF